MSKKCYFKDYYLVKKRGQKIRAWVDPPHYSGNARKKTFFLFRCLPLWNIVTFERSIFVVKIWCKLALASEYKNFIRFIQLDRKRRVENVHLLVYHATQICFEVIVENTLPNILQVSLSKSVHLANWLLDETASSPSASSFTSRTCQLEI